MRCSSILIWLATVTAYMARPWSCAESLRREVRPPDNPYHSIDPHSFGVLGAMIVALALSVPVLWLLLHRRPTDVTPGGRGWRIVATIVSIATPMILQLPYLALPVEWSWPSIAASSIWAVVVIVLCLRTAPGTISAHGAFDRFPRVAWMVVGAIGLGKLAIAGFMLIERSAA